MSMTTNKMKAATRYRYGDADTLQVAELDIPQPRPDQMLVKVHAATVNRTDCSVLTDWPFVIRFFTGLSKPGKPITGTDFAGEIVKVGNEVKVYKPGDRIFGFNDSGLSSHASYLCIGANAAVCHIPQQVGYLEAATSAEAAHYAVNFINKIRFKKGDKVLVNGGTGAIGSAAIQLLREKGIAVVATCASAHLEKVKSLGAEKVIDYTTEDFTLQKEKFDFVFDAVGKSTFGKCKNIMKPNAIYISSELGPYWQNIYLSLYGLMKKGKKVVFPFPENIPASLSYISNLLEKGKFKPLIDRIYKLDEITEAFRYVASGEKIGNVLIDMNQ